MIWKSVCSLSSVIPSIGVLKQGFYTKPEQRTGPAAGPGWVKAPVLSQWRLLAICPILISAPIAVWCCSPSSLVPLLKTSRYSVSRIMTKNSAVAVL
ncbi:hypothetical protein TREES_T100010053 [Tupaia chinensis]|uniref:Uncharacterized protein n=1 Tax=Tupaia chinensis TaxID=246437 RepID=L9KI44_TUPCH|nr:hypothetical protein TREES_T100010053 [Tupaia chinensis]